MGSDVGQIFPTASLHRDHSISYALICEKIDSIIGIQLGQENPYLRAYRSSGKQGLPSFPLSSGSSGWDFLEPLNSNDQLFFA